ncbi:MAG TPA: type II toxin-antitoxin system VapC family toxin [Caldimonas sp.]|nr:type II toxin-antitoxin system VapC family toxin [Caldimonas sp.]
MRTKGTALYVAEPPASYLVRPPTVVDCSVLVALLFDEPWRDAAAQLVDGRALHAPWLLDHEIASVAEKKRRAGVDNDVTAAAVAAYMQFDITMHRTAPDAVLSLAATYMLSAYDAAYLALASQLRAPLVTFDHKLGKAAVRHLGSLE